jgi:hypothetical protein
MKNIKNCYVALVVSAFSAFPVFAHEMKISFLNGKWTIPVNSTSAPARVLFHAGHKHPSMNEDPLAILNLCTDKEEKLFGIVTNNLVDSSAKKLKVDTETVVVDGHNFYMDLIPSNVKDGSEPLSISFLHESSMDENSIAISFDGGLNYYTATKKNSKITPACANHRRQEKRKSQSN